MLDEGNRVCQVLGAEIECIIIILRLGWGTISINRHATDWIQRHLDHIFIFAVIQPEHPVDDVFNPLIVADNDDAPIFFLGHAPEQAHRLVTMVTV